MTAGTRYLVARYPKKNLLKLLKLIGKKINMIRKLCNSGNDLVVFVEILRIGCLYYNLSIDGRDS